MPPSDVWRPPAVGVKSPNKSPPDRSTPQRKHAHVHAHTCEAAAGQQSCAAEIRAEGEEQPHETVFEFVVVVVVATIKF